MVERFANAARSTLVADIDVDDLSLEVALETAFPDSGTFRALVARRSGQEWVDTEIVKVTGVAGAVFTIERAAEPYAGEQVARAHLAGATVAQVITEGSLATLASGALDFGEVGDISGSTFADTAAAGATGEVADAGHRHAREANPITAHEAAGDPHPGYLTSAEGAAAFDAAGAAAAVAAAAVNDGDSAGGDLAGTFPNPTVAKASKSFALSGVLSDTLAANANNYAPTGIADATVLRITGNGFGITGIVGGVDGRVLIVQSISGDLLIQYQSSGSTAANRIIGPGSSASGGSIFTGQSVLLVYDGAVSRWRVLAHNPGTLAGNWSTLPLSATSQVYLRLASAAAGFYADSSSGGRTAVTIAGGTGAAHEALTAIGNGFLLYEAIPQLSDDTPLVESGAGDSGVDTESSRADHVHPAASGGSVPDGGDTGQFLGKTTDDDGDADWLDVLNASPQARRFLAHLQLGNQWGDSTDSGVLHGDSTLYMFAQDATTLSLFNGQAFIAPTSLSGNEPYTQRYIASRNQPDDAQNIYDLFAAPDPTDPRIDLVVLTITDLVRGTIEVQVIEGTPGPTPDAPATPDDALALWQVRIPAAETDATQWTLTDVREFVTLGSQDIDSVLNQGRQVTGQSDLDGIQDGIYGRPGAAGESGTGVYIAGGDGDGGTARGAVIKAEGGGETADAHGRARIYTDGTDGDDDDVLTAATRDGRTRAVWKPGRWEVLMADGLTNPPDPMTNEAGDDWLYGPGVPLPPSGPM